jgi:glutaconate CoA-transferase subunit A
MGRLPVEVSLEELVAERVPRDATIAIGGLHFHNTPMAVVREMIRQEIKIDRLIPPVDGSINADQLIGAGLVREIHTAYVGLEHFGMAPRFRAAAESRTLEIRETEEAGFLLGLHAGATGLPFVVLPEGFFPAAGDIPTIPAVNHVDYREIVNPFTNRLHHAALAIAPELAIVHCQLIDAGGTGAFLGSVFYDLEIAKAATHCIVLAEERVDELPAGCDGYLPGFLVDAFCVLPFGAHPGSSHGRYRYDEEHIRSYAIAARTAEGFAGYRQEVIGASEADYRLRAQGIPA